MQKIKDEQIKVRHRTLIDELAPRGHNARIGYYKGSAMTTLNPVVLYVYRASNSAAAVAGSLEVEQSNRCLLFVKVCSFYLYISFPLVVPACVGALQLPVPCPRACIFVSNALCCAVLCCAVLCCAVPGRLASPNWH